MPFSHFGLETGILRAVDQAGYVRPTPVQEASIPLVMEGRDVIAIAQTGTGKTAAFVLPMLHRLSSAMREGGRRELRALILAPTRELALQIEENIRAYGAHLLVRVASIYGGVDEKEQIKALKKGAQIIVATPGRLLDFIGRRKMDFSGLEMLVLDEADRMLHMGFLPDIENIIDAIPHHRQTLMFSATLSKEIESLARRFQNRPKMVQIGKRSNPADTVKQTVHEVPRHLKPLLLRELLREPKFTRVLVFVKMKDGANRVVEYLRSAGVRVAKLHSSRTQEQRNQALQDFKDGKVQVLVATDIAARGIDIDGVTHVVNYDFPVNPEDYVHRIGRTGRAESQGDAISFVPKSDLNLLMAIEHMIGRRLPRKRLRGFDYHASAPPLPPGIKPEKRDWRKRTREREEKKSTKGKPGAPAEKERKPAVKRAKPKPPWMS